MRVKQQPHRRRQQAAERQAIQQAEHDLAQGMAAIFVTAAARLLQQEHGWEREQAVAFGDRLLTTANTIALEVAAPQLGRRRRGGHGDGRTGVGRGGRTATDATGPVIRHE